MNDVVYILNQGSHWEDLELRYSLRSLEKHCTNYRNVVIVGYKPPFINDKVIHIPADDRHKNKARNIMEKVMVAAKSDLVTENFMLLNDDYFFVELVNACTYPYYHKCTLERTMEINKTEYFFHVKETKDLLESRGLPIDNYDTHKPIIYNKEKFIRVVEAENWDRTHGYILRSLYCNTIGVSGSYKLDVKVSRPFIESVWPQVIKEADVFSIGDRAINMEFKNFIDNLFPLKSQWEQ